MTAGEHPSSLTIALRLRSRGLSVFPVPRPGAGFDGKTPTLRWKHYQTHLATRADLEVWFAVPQNIAVATGALSGVVVVDCDNGDALTFAGDHLPETPWHTATARGWHFWYQHPGSAVPNRARVCGLPLDVKGDAGYVMAPGCVHATGARYRCRGDWTVPKTQLPVFSPDWLPSVRLQPDEEVTNGEGENITRLGFPTTDVVSRARAYLEAIPKPEIGYGSDKLTFIAACRLVRGFALSSADAEDVLWEWCGGRPGWTREWVGLKVRSAQDHGKELIGALL
jgi:hypothetical protein